MRRIWVGNSTLTESRREKRPREGEGALFIFNGRPGGDEGGDSVEQVWRRMVASSLCEVVLSVYGTQEAAQLFNK